MLVCDWKWERKVLHKWTVLTDFSSMCKCKSDLWFKSMICSEMIGEGCFYTAGCSTYTHNTHLQTLFIRYNCFHKAHKQGEEGVYKH